VVFRTFSPARAWRPAAGARLARTLGVVPVTTLSVNTIQNTPSDEALNALLADELARRLGPGPSADMRRFLDLLRSLPRGLRAMASVHALDQSIALDDLGWHFRNWHDLELAEETAEGLRELEANDHAVVFEKALLVARDYWDFFGKPDFRHVYIGSAVEAALSPLNERLWTIQGYRSEPGRSIVESWPQYSRKHPERVVVNDA
jgi:hypothetical protein